MLGDEDVSRYTDRALTLRVANEILAVRQDMGRMLAELAQQAGRLTALERAHRASKNDLRELGRREQDREITEVTNLKRELAKRDRESLWWKRRFIGASITVAVMVIAAYVCMRLGLRLP